MELWNGFQIERFSFEGSEALLVLPAGGPAHGRLVLKAEHWDAFTDTEVALLRKGFHLCFIRNADCWGTDEVIDKQARFVDFLITKYRLQRKVAIVGMSSGGMIGIRFAVKYPQTVSSLYLDAPLLDGRTIGHRQSQEDLLKTLGLEQVSQLDHWQGMPLFLIPELISFAIPTIVVAGDSDTVVPWEQNGALLESAYRRAGMDLPVFLKSGCGHHPHGLDDVTPVVDFIMKH